MGYTNFEEPEEETSMGFQQNRFTMVNFSYNKLFFLFSFTGAEEGVSKRKKGKLFYVAALLCH